RAERHEDERKAQDERQGVDQDAAAGCRRQIGRKIGDGHAGNERDVRRKERQYTGRQKGKKPRAERHRNPQRLTTHPVSIPSTSACATRLSHARGPRASAARFPSRSTRKLEGSARTP